MGETVRRGTLGFQGTGRETPRKKESRPKELCERPSDKPPGQPLETLKQQRKISQRRHIPGLYANHLITVLPLSSQKTPWHAREEVTELMEAAA